ncbi:STM3941 family protein [Empedobacter brevis]|uniref:STM3941 family protein n=1 Tax=Empedobacter brevis TaxID=247 RepID=UPI0039B04BC0
MNSVKVYAKQTSNWGLLFGSLLFLGGSIYLFFNANQVSSPQTAKILSGILFIPSILLIIISIKKLMKKQLILLIDKKGIVYKPSDSLNYIEWGKILEIEELKLPRQLVINIKIIDGDDFINNESNKFLQARMKFWKKMYGAIVSFDANTLDKNHFEIMNLFDEFMEDYKANLTSNKAFSSN